jgi:hypothetical protein
MERERERENEKMVKMIAHDQTWEEKLKRIQSDWDTRVPMTL